MCSTILERINTDAWQEAADCLLSEIEKYGMSEELAILGATICEHFCDYENMLSYIQLGLEKNNKNYELYIMLGNYYAVDNADKAYICYEYALELCNNNEDAACIRDMIESLRACGNIRVRPYSVITRTAGADLGIRRLNEIIDGEHAESDILILNHGVKPAANMIFALRLGLYEEEDIGIAGAVTNRLEGEYINQISKEQMLDEVFAQETADDFFVRQRLQKNAIESKIWLSGYAIMIKRDALENRCVFDERYDCYDVAVYDLCMQNIHNRHKNILCHNSLAFRDIACDDCREKLQNDMVKLTDKWGTNISYYAGVRSDLIPFITVPYDKPINVLEVGCGAGSTLGKIKYLYPNSNVYGIEIVEKVAAIGGVLYNINCGNIETMELEYEENYFDYIIFGDVIEHLTYPENVLKKLSKYLKKGGAIIASIPNLMNAEVIYNLLKGDFTYEPSGIRDRTHLRFFTYNEILRMFDRCGYDVSDIRVSHMIGHRTCDYGDFFDKILAVPGVADRQYFDAFQYLLRAEVRA